jgi:hypothetical protein
MLEHVLPHLAEQQKLDGAVDHPEFDPDYDVSGWPLLSDPQERQKLENFVLRKCISDRHKFKKADGTEGVVYFDSRGRAVHCAITEVPDADLVRLAREGGKRVKGQPNTKKPQTGKKDHGYTPPVQEDQELEEARRFPIQRIKNGADEMMNVAKTMQNLVGRIAKDGEETFRKRMGEEFQRAYGLSNRMLMAMKKMP